MNRITDFALYFKDYKEISKEDIFEYFHAHGKTKDDSIKVLVNRWTKQGILNKIKKGVYELTDKKKKLFKISSDKMQKKLNSLFVHQYPELSHSIWNSNSLNNLMIHQNFKPVYIFETEPDVLENVFYIFKENNINAFLSPNEDVISKYMSGSKNPVIIKNLVSRSPLLRKEGIPHPSIEKILVDIFLDRTIFQFAQGTELVNIYNEAFDSYVVNITKMLNYADRRKAREDITSFIRLEVNNPDIITLL